MILAPADASRLRFGGSGLISDSRLPEFAAFAIFACIPSARHNKERNFDALVNVIPPLFW